MRDTRYCYDGAWQHAQAIGTAANGGDGSGKARLTAVRRVLDAPGSGANSVDVIYAYDAYGNRTTQTEYGAYGTVSRANENVALPAGEMSHPCVRDRRAAGPGELAQVALGHLLWGK